MLCRYEDCAKDPGEKDFYLACRDFLPENIIVFHNGYLDGQQYDYLLLVPDYGVVVVEVKKWSRENFLGIEYGKLHMYFESEGDKYPDPYNQAST